MLKTVTSSPALSIEGVWKVFGPRAESFGTRRPADRTPEALAWDGLLGAVQDASFTLGRGEVFVAMGLSGSGKSTLLRCLTRLIEPTKGRIQVDGEDILALGPKPFAELRRKHIGMVFQHFALLPNRTVLGNVAFRWRCRGWTGGGLRRRL